MAKETNTNDKLIKSKYTSARIAPRKVVLVANAIRGMKVSEAMRFLDFNSQKSSGIIKGIVQTAIADGTHNFGIEKESMYVADVVIGPGPIRKGGRFAAKGTFKPIWKRTTHITVVLSGKNQLKESVAVIPKSNSKKETK